MGMRSLSENFKLIRATYARECAIEEILHLVSFVRAIVDGVKVPDILHVIFVEAVVAQFVVAFNG